uniref:Uncharacterized protein n=1 Tax=Anguilla anguilla TaxID=7936 RepID=A0A0E9VUM1_ANGAN
MRTWANETERAASAGFYQLSTDVSTCDRSLLFHCTSLFFKNQIQVMHFLTSLDDFSHPWIFGFMYC